MTDYDSDMGDLRLLIAKREVEEDVPTEAQRVRWAELEVERAAIRDEQVEASKRGGRCCPDRSLKGSEQECPLCGGAWTPGYVTSTEVAAAKRVRDEQRR